MAKITPANALNFTLIIGLLEPLITTLNPHVKKWYFANRLQLDEIYSEDRSAHDYLKQRIEVMNMLVQYLNEADEEKIKYINNYLSEAVQGKVMVVADFDTNVNVLYTHENIEAILKKLKKKIGRTTQKFEQAVAELLEEIKTEPIDE